MPDASQDPETTIGPYLLQQELGRGGQGVVFLAVDRRLGRRVAVKVLQNLGPGSAPILARFQREAAVASKLDHPGICTVYDAGVEDGVPFIAMRYVEGDSLATRLRIAAGATGAELSTRELGGATEVLDRSSMDAPSSTSREPRTATRSGISEFLRLIEKVARALHAVHEAGVIHRDLKPGNIMVTPSGEGVLMDFGLARDEASDQAGLTQTGDVFGTPAYMSPEQISGNATRLDRRTDVWSLGVVLYECLALRRPFEGVTREALYRAIVSKDPPEIRSLNRDVSRDLALVVLTALAKEPLRRYQTALDFAEELRRVREHEPILTRPARTHTKVLRFVQRNPVVSSLLVLVFFSLALGLVTTLIQKSRADARLKDWERLADGRRLEDLIRQADDVLWPAVPAKIGPLERWLDLARELAGRHDDHRAALIELRARALPEAPADSGAAASAERSRWDFEDARDQLRHDKLADLVKGLESLAESHDPSRVTIAGIESRLATSRGLERRTIEEHRALWEAALARIRAHRSFKGLQLSPQLGLIPLGPDPDSLLEEFSETLTGVPLLRGPDGRIEPSEDSALVFVLLPGGSITEGSQRSDSTDDNFVREFDANEHPVHEVTLDPFFLSKFEFTQGQWFRLMGSHPSYWRHENFPEITLRNPVDQVSWDQAQPALRRLGCRLPTEAQWEYACRAGTTSPWHTGDTASSLLGFANIADEGSKGRFQPGWIFERDFLDGHPFTSGVGLLRPNPLGLHDLHGNVWELCEDAFFLYDGHPPRPGDGLRAATGSRRVFRGGSFRTPAHLTRSAVRGRFASGYRDSDLGFRPARALELDRLGSTR